MGRDFWIFVTHEGSDERDFGLTDRIVERAMEKGFFDQDQMGTLKLGPPLSIPDDVLIEGLQVYEECFEELLA